VLISQEKIEGANNPLRPLLFFPSHRNKANHGSTTVANDANQRTKGSLTKEDSSHALKIPMFFLLSKQLL
jgi:hypothetical protein